ncbi:MAG: phosphoribosylglycinamide formyltransferase [Chloroflexota bacterium]|nr:phosphoribosylglycinamide formyltransferase [Chloroflexota bacterium]
MRLGVLASGGGTNLQAIIDACKSGELNADVCVVISNNSGSRALERAQSEGIPSYHISAVTHPHTPDGEICRTLEAHDVDLVLLAGYMRLLGPVTLGRYGGRVLNSHPALLPKFGGKGMYGSNVHRAVLDAGETVTGVTIHHVDGQYDHGDTLAQCEVPVLSGDTLESLEERVKERERRFWVETLHMLATQDRLTVLDDTGEAHCSR